MVIRLLLLFFYDPKVFKQVEQLRAQVSTAECDLLEMQEKHIGAIEQHLNNLETVTARIF